MSGPDRHSALDAESSVVPGWIPAFAGMTTDAGVTTDV